MCMSLSARPLQVLWIAWPHHRNLPSCSSGDWRWQLGCQRGRFLLRTAGEGFVSNPPPWLVDDRLLPGSFSLGLPSVHVRVLISSSEDTGHIGSGPTHVASFALCYLFKGPFSKYGPLLRWKLKGSCFHWVPCPLLPLLLHH